MHPRGPKACAKAYVQASPLLCAPDPCIQLPPWHCLSGHSQHLSPQPPPKSSSSTLRVAHCTSHAPMLAQATTLSHLETMTLFSLSLTCLLNPLQFLLQAEAEGFCINCKSSHAGLGLPGPARPRLLGDVCLPGLAPSVTVSLCPECTQLGSRGSLCLSGG